MTQHKTQAENTAGLFFDKYNINDRFEVEEKGDKLIIYKQSAKKRIPHPHTKGFE